MVPCRGVDPALRREHRVEAVPLRNERLLDEAPAGIVEVPAEERLLSLRLEDEPPHSEPLERVGVEDPCDRSSSEPADGEDVDPVLGSEREKAVPGPEDDPRARVAGAGDRLARGAEPRGRPLRREDRRGVPREREAEREDRVIRSDIGDARPSRDALSDRGEPGGQIGTLGHRATIRRGVLR